MLICQIVCVKKKSGYTPNVPTCAKNVIGPINSVYPYQRVSSLRYGHQQYDP